MEQDQMKKLIDRFILCYNSFDINGMMSLLHNNIIFQNVSNGKVDTSTKGKEEFQKLAEQSAKIFKSRQQKVTKYLFETEKVIVEIDYEGVLAIDLPNGLKSGEKLQLKGKSIYSLKNDLIMELVDYS